MEELVERLKNASRYENAGDLLILIPDFKAEEAVDLYSKANKFLKAIQLATSH